MFKSTLMHRLRSSATAFQRDEDGILTIFGVGIFILMMLSGGVALDFMRFEAERSRIQNTLDRATLAAASLSQEVDQQRVINDYFRASGLAGYDVDIQIEETNNSRKVTATSSAPVRSLFLNMLGVDSITAPASSGAQEQVQEVEISLVLDVSGSMGGEKIRRMREAAGDFVQEMLEAPEPGQPQRVSISIVPYNGMVNVGSFASRYYNLSSAEHTLSSCSRFDADDFLETSISTSASIRRLAHFDTHTDDLEEEEDRVAERDARDNSLAPALRRPYCPTGDRNAIVPFASDPDALEAYIDGFNAGGMTAIDAGVKWGVALVDPSARSRVTAMINDSAQWPSFAGSAPVVDPDHAGRPFDYGTPNTLKVVVVMTDGANTLQQDLQSDRRGDTLSPIFAYHPDFAGSGGQRDADIEALIRSDDYRTRYSVYFDQMGTYYEWDRDDRRPNPVGGNNAVQLTWHEVNSLFAIDTMQDQIVWRSGWRSWEEGGETRWRYRNGRYAEDQWMPQGDYNFWREENDYVYTETVQADRNLANICSAARNNGVLIYTIAFNAPPEGEAAMRDCAHLPSFYFNVQGLNIAEAFDGIKASIKSLKLIQ